MVFFFLQFYVIEKEFSVRAFSLHKGKEVRGGGGRGGLKLCKFNPSYIDELLTNLLRNKHAMNSHIVCAFIGRRLDFSFLCWTLKTVVLFFIEQQGNTCNSKKIFIHFIYIFVVKFDISVSLPQSFGF